MTEYPLPRCWGDKRYHSLNFHWRQLFGEKIGKIVLDGGFTCPNRDGTKGWGGCIFCSPAGSGDYIAARGQSIARQYEQGRETLQNKWVVNKYIAYLQSFTNTYAPVERLREVYKAVLGLPGVVGLSIATRPDCLPEEVLDLLAEISRQHYLIVELGLQTIHERSADYCNLKYGYRDYLNAVDKLLARQIKVCSHIILGLPGEDRNDMMATAKAVASLPTQGIKIQLLHLLYHTKLAEIYEKQPFPFLSQEQYVELVVSILEILPPAMVIHRLTGDGPRSTLIGPDWSRNKRAVLNDIERELIRRNSWQGKFYANDSKL